MGLGLEHGCHSVLVDFTCVTYCSDGFSFADGVSTTTYDAFMRVQYQTVLDLWRQSSELCVLYFQKHKLCVIRFQSCRVPEHCHIFGPAYRVIMAISLRILFLSKSL